MKTQKNNPFEKIKASYKMPDDYFQNLETKLLKNERKTFHIGKYSSKLMLAAGIILLLGLGYVKFTDYSLPSVVKPTDSLQTGKEQMSSDPLYGIDDEEIMEFLDYNMDESDLSTITE